MLNWFSSWMVNPWLLGLGTLLVAAPIIIHLLNKRRFKVVDWAAMDFLLDADKRNRRRVRLENLLLLLLRCLTVFLIGLLLARPFLPTGLTAGLLETAQFERIVLLDDSLSMQVQSGNESAMDAAKRSLTDLVRNLATGKSDDTLTLLVTSQPDQRQINAALIRTDTLGDLIDTIESLEATDRPANLAAALLELEHYVATEPKNVNRVVYVLTDMRERDWTSEQTDGNNQPAQILRRLAKQTNGCFLIDVAGGEHNNVAITSIRPEDTLVAGVSSRFDVTLANFGDAEVRDLTVKFTAGQSIPLTAEIEQIAAGGSATAAFSFTFAPPELPVADDGIGNSSRTAPVDAIRVQAEVVTIDPGAQDRLAADSTRFFAARVVPGIPTLIVDGDPSATYGRSESFYLQRALVPPGQSLSGIAVEVITESELETVRLDKYQVIFLCNLYRLSQPRLEALEAWTRAGGGLILMPGDQTDESFFNQQLYRDATGLSPIRLEGLRGDESESTWSFFHIVVGNHVVLRVFEGQNNPFLDRVKTFRWWGASMKPEQLGRDVAVLARFTDVDESPAIVERSFDSGRVVALTIPADADWSTWTDDPSYLITMQELVRYMARNVGGSGDLAVGQPLRQPVDLTQYKMDAALHMPGDQRIGVQAAPAETSQQSADQTVWKIVHADTDRRGFYELELTRTDGGSDRVLFAANVDPREGDLKRLDTAALKRELGDAPVTISTADAAAAQGVRGSQHEVWHTVLAVLVGVLCGEQILGWLFGLRR